MLKTADRPVPVPRRKKVNEIERKLKSASQTQTQNYVNYPAKPPRRSVSPNKNVGNGFSNTLKKFVGRIRSVSTERKQNQFPQKSQGKQVFFYEKKKIYIYKPKAYRSKVKI